MLENFSSLRSAPLVSLKRHVVKLPDLWESRTVEPSGKKRLDLVPKLK